MKQAVPTSVSQAIRIVQNAGYDLRPDGEGLWHVNGGGGMSSAALIVFATLARRASACPLPVATGDRSEALASSRCRAK